MPARTVRAALITLTLVLMAGCAAKMRSGRIILDRQKATRLARSYFSRDPQGQLSEKALQRILGAKVEIDLPARVGVLPIIRAKDWRGPAPDFLRVPLAAQKLAMKLKGSESFPAVTEMMPIPSGALGMEALREAAARYQLRYILLYRESFRRAARVNPWAIAYLTVIGALFAPGRTLGVTGFVEASLFDVKTGLFCFTVRRHVEAESDTNLWSKRQKLERLQRALTTKIAPKLAADIRMAVARFREASKLENRRKTSNAHASWIGRR